MWKWVIVGLASSIIFVLLARCEKGRIFRDPYVLEELEIRCIRSATTRGISAYNRSRSIGEISIAFYERCPSSLQQQTSNGSLL